MNKPNKKVFLILVILFVAVLLIFVAIKTQEFTSKINEMRSTPDPLRAELMNMITRYNQGEISMIDISAITTFSWDRLYIFGQYTGSSELDPIVGRTWRNIDNCFYWVAITENSDGYSLFVFTKENTAVYCLTFPRDRADFYINEKEYKSGFLREETIFVLDDLGQGWISQVKK